MSGPTARARFDGRVHGVVVQTRISLGRSSSSEQHRDRRVLPVAVGVVLPGLEVGKRRLALPAVGEHLVALVEQALVVQRLEGPQDALHVGEVHGLVVVVEVDPAGLAARRSCSHSSVYCRTDRGSASLNSSIPMLEDGRVPGDAELLLGLHLGGQAVAVPAEAALDPPAPHRLVAGDGVLHEAGEQVAVVGEAVGERRPVVEDELVGPVVAGGTVLDRGAEGVVAPPVLEDLALDGRERRLLGDVRVRRRTRGRRLGHAFYDTAAVRPLPPMTALRTTLVVSSTVFCESQGTR